MERRGAGAFFWGIIDRLRNFASSPESRTLPQPDLLSWEPRTAVEKMERQISREIKKKASFVAHSRNRIRKEMEDLESALAAAESQASLPLEEERQRDLMAQKNALMDKLDEENARLNQVEIEVEQVRQDMMDFAQGIRTIKEGESTETEKLEALEALGQHFKTAFPWG